MTLTLAQLKVGARRLGYSIAAWATLLAGAVAWAAGKERNARRVTPPLHAGGSLRLPAPRTPLRGGEAVGGVVAGLQPSTSTPDVDLSAATPPLGGRRG